jgi:ADP-ribosyl-[dinitrogen reductase] hydrolase
LRRFETTGEPFAGSTAPNTAGNGSIMRLAPAPMFAGSSLAEAIRLSRESSRTTHGADECLDACQVLGALLHHLISGVSKEDALARLRTEEIASSNIRAITDGSYLKKSEDEVRSTGYVVHTLEAALWSFARTTNFQDAVLAAVNLGDDADTTGAVCGQIAGAFYGADGIPPRWLELLAKRDLITDLATRLG